MTKLRVNAFTVSADGFGAGPDQSRDQPLGRGGEQLHQWFVPTRTFQRERPRADGGLTGTDDDFAARSFENLGARSDEELQRVEQRSEDGDHDASLSKNGGNLKGCNRHGVFGRDGRYNDPRGPATSCR